VISEIKLRFGRAPGLPSEKIRVAPVTVFVGPNNSGKSKVLMEIYQYCRSGQKNSTALIVDEITLIGVEPSLAKEVVSHLTLRPQVGEILPEGYILVGARGARYHVHPENFLKAFQDPNSNAGLFCEAFLSYNTLMLGGRDRINLVNPQSGGDLQSPVHLSFQVLFRDNTKRIEVRRIVADAFGCYFVLDPTNLGQIRIRLASRPPVDEMEERGLHEAAVNFHGAAQPIEEASDGVKAFTGILTELIAGDPRILLIDEPEAFLHPSLAFKLGYEVSRAALQSDKRVFASTHSPTFVMGCIQSGAPVNIVRLTYRSGVATARILPSDEILELMRNPLLRSTGVMSGLFYEFVIVTESDADRAFYEEINERLLRFNPEWGIPNCLFINAQNKQTVPTIVRPLRKLGIPAAGIVDVDIIKEGGAVWTNLLTGAYVPELSHHSWATQRAAIKQAMDKTGLNMKREGGLAILPPGDREAAQNLFDQLGRYGIFAVPGGELESWLKHLGASSHGPAWLVAIFERMGDEPDHPDYVKPTGDDVWKFLSAVKAWLIDPARKGIPS
jgi:hypothetical protein